MPILTQGASVDLTVNADSTLTLQSPNGGLVTVENPVGTVVWRGGEANRRIDLKSGIARVTANTRDVFYELASDPAQEFPVTFDPLTGQMRANGSPVSGAGNIVNGFQTTARGLQIDFTNTASLSLATWTGGTGTLTLTREVMLDGRPTLRVDMPAACTRVELGVTSGFSLPTGWDSGVNRTMGCPVHIVDRTPFGVMQLYVGDSTYTNYDLLTVDINTNEPWNGWHVLRYRDTAPGENNPSKVGPVTQANVTQGKIRINKSAGTAGTVYLSWMGTMPREQAKILWTADDGYDEWATWLMPTATLYGIPWALGFDRFYSVNNVANFMTEAQVRAMAADSTGLFEMYPHGFNNQSFASVGLNQYLANDDATWSWLQGLGVRNQRIYHPYIQGSYDETLVQAMKARGVLIGRTVTGSATPGRTYKPSIANTQQADSNLRAPIGLSLEAGVSLATAKAAIDTAESTGSTLIIMAHEFVTGGLTGLQWTQADTAALMEYAAAKERAGRAQNIKASQLAAQIVQPG